MIRDTEEISECLFQYYHNLFSSLNPAGIEEWLNKVDRKVDMDITVCLKPSTLQWR